MFGGLIKDITMVSTLKKNVSSPVISFKNVSVAYKNHLALENINGDLLRGGSYSLLGPNGGGKSTLLKVIMGLIRLKKGSIKYHGIQRRDIAFLPQLSEVDRSFPLTVRDVVALGHCPSVGFFKSISNELQAQVSDALDKMGLGDYGDRALHTLSGGQFQRMLFARVSLQKASVIMLDEPFTGIDSYTMDDLLRILGEWNKAGKTLIVVSHDLDVVRTHFQETILLARRIISWGKTKEVVTLESLAKANHMARRWDAFADQDENTQENNHV